MPSAKQTMLSQSRGVAAGVGIAQRGLRSLFKEYVQGSEEEMKRPRSRGGTGLGLSICSKQVLARFRAITGLLKPLAQTIMP